MLAYGRRPTHRFATLRGSSLLAGLLLALIAGDGLAEQHPTEAYFRDPLLREIRLSPSGRFIAGLLPFKDGMRSIDIWDLETNTHTTIPTREQGFDMRVRWLEWANDRRLIYSLGDVEQKPGAPFLKTQLVGIDRSGENSNFIDVRWEGQKHTQIHDRLLSMLRDDPQRVLLEYHGRAMSVDVHTGLERIEQARFPRIRQWQASYDGRVLAGTGVGTKNTKQFVFGRGKPSGPFEHHLTFDFVKDPHLHIEAIGYEEHGTGYVTSTHAGDQHALYRYDLATGEFGDELVRHPRYDQFSHVLHDRVRRKVVGVALIEEAPEFHYWDDEAEALQRAIDAKLPDRINWIGDRSDDGTRMLVYSGSDRHVPETYLFDRKAGTLTLLLRHYDLPDESLAPMKTFEYEARDGLAIQAFLTLPSGRGEGPVPVIVMPHSQDRPRDGRSFYPEVQFLASRGYAVFQPNYRGSLGYGLAFHRAGYRQWGRAMQNDITDGLKALVDAGIADKKRIAIYGHGGYAGYAAMMGLVRSPKLYACAASYGGIFDLADYFRQDDWYWQRDAYNQAIIADPRSGDLASYSPARHASRIRAPVFLAHGKRDIHISAAQSTAMAEALEKAGRPADQLLLMRYAGRALDIDAYRIQLYRELEPFFARCLRGPGGS